MLKWLGCQSVVLAEVMFVAVLVVGNLVWVDTFHLCDDRVLPLAGISWSSSQIFSMIPAIF